jgi:hypothetical protein
MFSDTEHLNILNDYKNITPTLTHLITVGFLFNQKKGQPIKIILLEIRK